MSFVHLPTKATESKFTNEITESGGCYTPHNPLATIEQEMKIGIKSIMIACDWQTIERSGGRWLSTLLEQTKHEEEEENYKRDFLKILAI